MGIKNQLPSGPNFVPSYQISGIPYVTSSNGAEAPSAADVDLAGGVVPIEVQFPQVTRFVCVTNTGTQDLRVGFSQNGVMDPVGTAAAGNETRRNYFIIDKDQPSAVRMEVRCTKLFFLSDGSSGNGTGFSVLAGLTGVDRGAFPPLTGTLGAELSFEGIG